MLYTQYIVLNLMYMYANVSVTFIINQKKDLPWGLNLHPSHIIFIVSWLFCLPFNSEDHLCIHLSVCCCGNCFILVGIFL